MANMLLLGLDFETTGLDVTKEHIIEVGAVLWDSKMLAPLQIDNFLVRVPDISAEITEITGITQPMLDVYGIDMPEGLKRLYRMLDPCDAVVAHNGTTFDHPILDTELKRNGFAMDPWERLWIDTSLDVPYPERTTTRKLVHLAAEHGFVNPFAHRAVFDVLTMLKVLSCYDVDQVADLARQPNVTIQALVSFDNKEKAKARGYRWKADTKQWIKVIKLNQLDRERNDAGFKVNVLQ